MRNRMMRGSRCRSEGCRVAGIGSAMIVATASVALLDGFQQGAHAITYTSIANNVAASWSEPSRWNANGTPTSDPDTVIVFSTTLNTTMTNDLGTIQLNRLSSTNTGSKSQTIAGNSTNNLNFVTSSTSVLPTMALANNGSATTISIPFTVTNGLTITNSGAGQVTFSGAINNLGGITLDGSGGGNLLFQSNPISNSGGVTVSGSYATIFTAAQTYTGATVINTGATLQLGNATTTGKISLSSAITNDGTLAFRRTNAVTQGTDFGTISGSGAVRQSGTNTLTLNAANDYTGGTIVNSGTLTVGSGGTLGATTGSLSVNNTNTGAGSNVVLNLATGADTTVGSLSGTIANPSSGTNTATINTGGAARNFTVNQTVAGNYAGVIAGAGSFTLGSLSTNALTLTGVNTYTGDTTVDAGTLILADNGGLKFVIGAPDVNNRISGTGTLNLDGDFTFDLTNAGASLGDSWNIVNVATLAETFGSTFSVAGFDDANLDDVWTQPISPTLEYRFSEATGVLSVAAVPEPASLGLLGLGALLVTRRRGRIG